MICSFMIPIFSVKVDRLRLKYQPIHRLRISSIEPNLLTNETIDFVATSNSFVPHFHIPLQSGDATILARMNRHYHPDFYRELVLEATQRIPDLAVGADVLVGFPGETDDDFEILLHFLREAQLDRVGCFQYSPVEGARANALPDHVAPELMQERWERFMDVQQAISAAKLQAKVGTTQEILIDSVSAEGALGRSTADAPEIDGQVHLPGITDLAPGDFVEAEITAADEYDLFVES